MTKKRRQPVVKNEVVLNRLQQVRLERRWSKAGLGRRADVHPSDVGRIENGRMRPYPDQLLRIAKALGVNPADAHTLLDPADAPVPASTSLRASQDGAGC